MSDVTASVSVRREDLTMVVAILERLVRENHKLNCFALLLLKARLELCLLGVECGE